MLNYGRSHAKSSQNLYLALYQRHRSSGLCNWGVLARNFWAANGGYFDKYVVEGLRPGDSTVFPRALIRQRSVVLVEVFGQWTAAGTAVISTMNFCELSLRVVGAKIDIVYCFVSFRLRLP